MRTVLAHSCDFTHSLWHLARLQRHARRYIVVAQADNAVAESFFGSLKKERIKKQIYKSRELAAADVADYIVAFYNRSRRHGHLGGVSPEQFEAAHRVRRQGVH